MSVNAEQIKQLIIEVLALEDIQVSDIDDDAPLFGDGLGLDSIDALELGLALKKQFNVCLNAESEETKRHFQSVNSLLALINSQGQ